MSNWSPYAREPFSPSECAYWSWLAFIHMGAFGTPHYQRLDPDRRREFEGFLADGTWHTRMIMLRQEAARLGLPLTEAMQSAHTQALTAAIAPGKPLPPTDRRRCVTVAAEWLPIKNRLEVEHWRTNPTRPAGWVEPSAPGETEAAELVLSQLVAECRPQHAPDFSWVRCHLGEFTFSTNQRPVVKALWSDWEAGGLGLGQAYLIDLAGRESSQLKGLFRDHPAWGVLVVLADRKEMYRLRARPEPDQKKLTPGKYTSVLPRSSPAVRQNQPVSSKRVPTMPEVLSTYRIAERFGVSPSWIRSQAKAGCLPHLRAGRRLLFNPEAVAVALARMAATTPDRKAVADVR